MKKKLSSAIIIVVALVCIIVLMRTRYLPNRDETLTGQTVKDVTVENNMEVEDERPIIRDFRPELVTPDEKTIEKLSVIKDRMRKLYWFSVNWTNASRRLKTPGHPESAQSRCPGAPPQTPEFCQA